jgi:hypothetical protein
MMTAPSQISPPTGADAGGLASSPRPAGDDDPPRRLFSASLLLRITGVGCLVWLFATFDYRAVWRLWMSLDLTSVVVVVLLAVVCTLIKFWRWHGLLGLSGCRAPVGFNFGLYNLGLFWGLVSPGRLGEFVKCHRLKRDLGLPYMTGVALILFDRLFDVFALGLGLVLGGVVLFGRPGYVYLTLALVLVVLMLARLFLSRLVRGIGWLASRLGRDLGTEAVERMVHRVISVRGLGLLALTLAGLALMIYQAWFLAGRAYGLELGVWQMLFLASALYVSALLPLSICGLGTNEVASLLLVKQLMPQFYQPEKLIAFSLSLTLLNVLPSIVWSGAMVLIFRRAAAKGPRGQGG